jgi:hypothetical protein
MDVSFCSLSARTLVVVIDEFDPVKYLIDVSIRQH